MTLADSVPLLEGHTSEVRLAYENTWDMSLAQTKEVHCRRYEQAIADDRLLNFFKSHCGAEGTTV